MKQYLIGMYQSDGRRLARLMCEQMPDHPEALGLLALLLSLAQKYRHTPQRAARHGSVHGRCYSRNVSFRPILLKVRQVKPGGVGSHVKENATENF